MVVTRGRGQTHQERLEHFYQGQAAGYDAFRRRLLHGRSEMIRALPFPENGVWVDLGAGTGENVEHAVEQLPKLKTVYLVDLCRPLLKVAEQRIADRQWNNVKTVHDDATAFTPTGGVADVVTFSYSLTMIPDWFAALENARRLLKPGGIIGVSDFYVSRKHPPEGRRRHGWGTRTFWPTWFATDDVFLHPDHLPALQRYFEPVVCVEGRGRVPYVPFLRAPYYYFIGRKKADAADVPS